MRRRPLVLVSLAASISLLAFVARTEKPSGAAHYSDREIFEGVVFGVGPVANLLPESRDQLRPELYARSADELAAMSAARATLIDAVERTDPGFVAAFARVARSGDPAAIRLMLEHAADAVNNAAGVDRSEIGDGTLLANLPIPTKLPGSPSPAPAPRPAPKPGAPQLFANLPIPTKLPGSPSPAPAPRPAPKPGAPQLFANLPIPTKLPGSPSPAPAPRPGPQPGTSVGSVTPVAAQPAWALFSSQLFSEQLAASIAVKLERSAPTEG